MNFNSAAFFVFLPAVLVVYSLVFRREHLRDTMLLASSYVFYMSWNWKYAGLIAFSTIIDYLIGIRLEREERHRHRKLLLVASLTVNLGLLAVFKYYNFFMNLGEDALSLFGSEVSIPHHRLLLPVGISFYTFQTLSYTIDLYKREIRHERNLIKFALYVSFFPQLVAGPIVRASHFLPQLQRTPTVHDQRFSGGLYRVFKGLFKKIILADMLALLAVDAVFESPSAFSSLDLLLVLYAYSFQIYNDFSGYSDIAIGAAMMLGFDIPENFDRPYLAQNVREFWRRWHISLSTWLRDYLYIPLGGSRGGKGRVAFNLMTTMVLGGLWHGAALNFVLWGFYHGLLLGLERTFGRKDEASSMLMIVRRRIVCFHLVLFGWLLFRVTSWQNAVEYLEGLARFDAGTQFHPYFFVILVLAFVLHISSQNLLARVRHVFLHLPIPLRSAAYLTGILVFCAFSLDAPSFIYFQF